VHQQQVEIGVRRWLSRRERTQKRPDLHKKLRGNHNDRAEQRSVSRSWHGDTGSVAPEHAQYKLLHLFHKRCFKSSSVTPRT